MKIQFESADKVNGLMTLTVEEADEAFLVLIGILEPGLRQFLLLTFQLLSGFREHLARLYSVVFRMSLQNLPDSLCSHLCRLLRLHHRSRISERLIGSGLGHEREGSLFLVEVVRLLDDVAKGNDLVLRS